jgi:hypothetical protein
MLVSVCGTTVYCKAVNNCEAYPTCDAGDVEVEECPPGLECYETSICGATITCAPGGTCGAVPTCDPGDMEITGACPSGVSCYELTLCDTTITCRDDTAPAHGCPLAEPTTGGACDPATAPAECEYPPCGFYGCVETNGVFEWTATGGCG